MHPSSLFFSIALAVGTSAAVIERQTDVYTQPYWWCPNMPNKKIYPPSATQPALTDAPGWCLDKGGDLECVNNVSQACVVYLDNETPPTPSPGDGCVPAQGVTQFWWLRTKC